MKDVNAYIDYLVDWIKDVVVKANVKGVILGVSGGVDSAVVAGLIKKAFPNNSLGLILPIHSKESDASDAVAVCDKLGLSYKTVDLSDAFDVMKATFEKDIEISESYKMSLANTKARLRMTTLYAYAQNYGYLVVGTDNACEWFTGYFTKYGDGGVDLVPLVHLLKSEVYQLAKALDLPESVITKAPSAGLIEGVNDEDELKVTYQELEDYIQGKPVSEHVAQRCAYLHKISAHKRDGATKPSKKASDF